MYLSTNRKKEYLLSALMLVFFLCFGVMFILSFIGIDARVISTFGIAGLLFITIVFVQKLVHCIHAKQELSRVALSLLSVVLFALFFFEFAPIGAFSENIASIDKLFQGGFCAIAGGLIVWICYLLRKNPALPEYSVILALVCAFVDTALFSEQTTKNINVSTVFFIVCINIAFVFCIVWFIHNKLVNWYLVKKLGKISFKTILGFVDGHLFSFLVMFYITVRWSYLPTPPKFDSILYTEELFRACAAYDFSLRSLFEVFAIFGHPSNAIAAYMAIGQYISYGSFFLLNAQSMLLNILAAYAFYKILEYYFDKVKFRHEIVLSTFLFIFSPVVFGVSLQFDTDFSTLIFFVCLFAAYLYNKKLLFFAASFMLVFSKEFGAILYAIFVFSSFLITLWNNKKRVKIVQTIFDNYYLFVSGIFLGLYFLYSNQMRWRLTVPYSLPNHFWIAFKSVFFVNFTWLLALFSIGSILLSVIHSRKKIIHQLHNSTKNYCAIIPLILASIGYLLCGLCYNIYVLPRYFIAWQFYVVFTFSFTAILVFKDKKRRIVTLSVAAVLLFSSVFYSYDPLMRVHKGAIVGGRTMYALGENRFTIDNIVYNAQHARISLALDQLLQKTKITEDDCLFFFPPSDNLNKHENGLAPEDQFFTSALGLSAFNRYSMGLDATSSQITAIKENAFIPQIVWPYKDENVLDTLIGIDEIVYIFLDWHGLSEEEELGILTEHFTEYATETVTVKGFTATAHRMRRNSNSQQKSILAEDIFSNIEPQILENTDALITIDFIKPHQVNRYLLSGWFLDPLNNRVADRLFLEINGIYYEGVIVERRDVGEAFGETFNMSGFEVHFPLSSEIDVEDIDTWNFLFFTDNDEYCYTMQYVDG